MSLGSIAKALEEARRKMVEAYEHQHFEPTPWQNLQKGSVEEYARRRLVGTPDQCISQLEKWLQEDVDFIHVGWTMSLDDWKLFATKVVPAFQ
jgi:alkanesulfonate monooxygenase SsuD/methylene tetrahydromethanopterin reductase-like flavin-dependent oxidoreductase (luciferase family)